MSCLISQVLLNNLIKRWKMEEKKLYGHLLYLLMKITRNAFRKRRLDEIILSQSDISYIHFYFSQGVVLSQRFSLRMERYLTTYVSLFLYAVITMYNFSFYPASSLLMTCLPKTCMWPSGAVWNIYNFIWHVFPEYCHSTNYTVMWCISMRSVHFALIVIKVLEFSGEK